MVLEALNLWAVAICAALWAGSVAVWYSPFLFGETWQSETGTEDGNAGPGGYLAALLGVPIALSIAVSQAWFAQAGGDLDWLSGAAIGLFIWLGLGAPARLMEAVYRKTGLILLAVDLGHSAITIALMGAVLGAWT